MKKCEDCKNLMDCSTDKIHAGICKELGRPKHIKNPACKHFQPKENKTNEH